MAKVALYGRGDPTVTNLLEQMKRLIPGLHTGSEILDTDQALSFSSWAAILEFKMEKSINPEAKGYSIETTEHSKLAEAFNIGLANFGSTPNDAIPVSLIPPRLDGTPYIRVTLGYETNQAESGHIKTGITYLAECFRDAIEAPDLQNAEVDKWILNEDPYMETKSYVLDEYYSSVGGNLSYNKTTFKNIPVTSLELSSGSPEHKAFVSTKITGDYFGTGHIILFTARLTRSLQAGEEPSKVYLVQGGTYKSFEVNRNDWVTYEHNFMPGYTQPLNKLIPLTLIAKPYSFEIPISILGVSEEPYRREKTFPLMFEVRPPNDIYIGVSGAVPIEFIGICVYKEGYMGDLDNPRYRYKPYQGNYELTENNEGNTPVGIEDAGNLPPGAFMPSNTPKDIRSGFFDKLVQNVSQALISDNILGIGGFADSGLLTSLLGNYTEVLGPVLSVMNSLGGGCMNFDLNTIVTNSLTLLNVINESSLTSDQKAKANKFLLKVQIVARGKEHAIEELTNMAKDYALKDAQVQEVMRKVYTGVGEGLAEATKLNNKIQAELRKVANHSLMINLEPGRTARVGTVATGNILTDALANTALKGLANVVLENSQEIFFDINGVLIRLNGEFQTVARNVSGQIAGRDYTTFY